MRDPVDEKMVSALSVSTPQEACRTRVRPRHEARAGSLSAIVLCFIASAGCTTVNSWYRKEPEPEAMRRFASTVKTMKVRNWCAEADEGGKKVWYFDALHVNPNYHKAALDAISEVLKEKGYEVEVIFDNPNNFHAADKIFSKSVDEALKLKNRYGINDDTALLSAYSFTEGGTYTQEREYRGEETAYVVKDQYGGTVGTVSRPVTYTRTYSKFKAQLTAVLYGDLVHHRNDPSPIYCKVAEKTSSQEYDWLSISR